MPLDSFAERTEGKDRRNAATSDKRHPPPSGNADSRWYISPNRDGIVCSDSKIFVGLTRGSSMSCDRISQNTCESTPPNTQRAPREAMSCSNASGPRISNFHEGKRRLLPPCKTSRAASLPCVIRRESPLARRNSSARIADDRRDGS